MGRVFEFLGMSVGFLPDVAQDDVTIAQRQAAVDADVTYTTAQVGATCCTHVLNCTVVVEMHRCTWYTPCILSGTVSSQLPLPLQTIAFTFLDDTYSWRAPSDVILRRPLAFAIVDEADSILIDRSVEPHILSGPAEEGDDALRYRIACMVRMVACGWLHVVLPCNCGWWRATIRHVIAVALSLLWLLRPCIHPRPPLCRLRRACGCAWSRATRRV